MTVTTVTAARDVPAGRRQKGRYHVTVVTVVTVTAAFNPGRAGSQPEPGRQ